MEDKVIINAWATTPLLCFIGSGTKKEEAWDKVSPEVGLFGKLSDFL